LERLHCELSNTAVAVVVAASIACVLKQKPAFEYSIADVLDFSPAQSGLSTSTSEKVLRYETIPTISYALLNLASRFRFSQKLSGHLIAKYGKEPVTSGELEVHSDAWRRTCGAVLRAIKLIETTLGTGRDADLVDQDRWLEGLLTRVVDGEAPCITETGIIEVPKWAERRSSKRVKSNESAQVIVGDEVREAAIIDASTHGLGLSGDVSVGELAKVKLGDGRHLVGSVEWVRDGRFGLRLETPLKESDRLLTKEPVDRSGVK
jgi:hypothetical protein